MIHDMYRGAKTRVKTRCGRTEYFDVKVWLHQRCALSPLLYIIVMDVLAEEARTKPPWAMLFADDLVLVSETVEEELERRGAVIENNGFKHPVSGNNLLSSPKLCRPLTYRHANYQSKKLL